MRTIRRWHAGTATTVALVLSGLLCEATPLADQSSQAQQAQFRAGVDLTRLELTVLDKRTRKPIAGLTADDFVVKVDGDVQPIRAVAEVSKPLMGDAHVDGLADASRDVATNALVQPRLFVILMNDASGNNDPFNRRTGRQIAHRIIDDLLPDDLAAVVFTRDNRHAQDFTADRTLLRQAVDRYNPMQTVGIRPMDVVKRAQHFMAMTAGSRRAVMYISPVEWANFATNQVKGLGFDEVGDLALREMSAISAGAGIGHVPIYPFSTHGLHGLDMSRDDMWAIRDHIERLQTVAGLTGGRAVVAHNTPAQVVPAVFEELAAHYALGFAPTYPSDGKLRWLEVEVLRPDTMVMPTGLPIMATRALSPVERGTAMSSVVDSGLREALGSPIPSGAVPLRLSAVPVSVARARDQAVALTLALPPVAVGVTETFRVAVLVFDGEGRREVKGLTHDVTLQGSQTSASAGTEIALRVDLRPARYNIRVTVEQLSQKVAGSVHATVTVPDFEADALAVTGVAVGLAGTPPAAGQEAIADLLPFAPTSVRTFATTDRVGALIRVHQRSKGSAQQTVVETTIIDSAGARVFGDTRKLSAALFEDGVGVDHAFDVPLLSIEPGNHLLRFVVTAGDSRVQRDVRFSVK